ncbi:MAG TPA: Fe-S protein assembly co-chaperone HscB [Chitinophagaceae bacterium]|nr:Fe-S protein assembly co-chaperone HscB [Chitinophagaceae bacterium]
MNYFELFEIPVQLNVDKNSITKKYFELSRKYHPDYFARQDEKAQEDALQKSALLNKGYKTFQNHDETIRYVLHLKGLIEEEEKYELPPDFLMEVLEINEKLMDGPSTSSGADNLQSAVDKLENEIYEPVKEIVEGYQEGITSKEEMLRVKEYYYKKKYLDRIKRQLKGND